MATYVTLYRYTDQGARAIRNAVELAQQWQQEAERRGVKVLADLRHVASRFRLRDHVELGVERADVLVHQQRGQIEPPHGHRQHGVP